MQFVDGRGNPIQLLSGPKPSPHSYKDPLDRSDFEKLVKTSIYQITVGTKKPGEWHAVHACMFYHFFGNCLLVLQET